MNKIIICGLAVATLGVMSSCSKEFLDPEVTDYVTAEQLQEFRKDASMVEKLSQASLAATYNDLEAYWSSHDDFGLKALQLSMDLLTEDMPYVGLNADWFYYDYQLDNLKANYRRTSSTWDMFYDIVSTCNIVLRDYFPEDVTDEAILSLKAEPLAMRGIAFFYLVNFYQANYKGHESAMGVPLTLTPEDGNLPRATVKEVYDRIIRDLTFAVEHGEVTAPHTDADKAVAAAYLAKAYASMEDWANTEKYAHIALEGAEDKVPDMPMGWTIGAADVLWGYDVTSNTTTYWASFYSHMDPTVPNYAGRGQEKGIYNWLYQQMGPRDVRRKLFIDVTLHPDIAMTYGYGYKEVKDDKGEVVDKIIIHDHDYYALKFVSPEGTESDYIFLRVQDPLLLEIEAINEQGRTAEAAKMLNEFMQKRDPDYKAPADQAALREQIRINRRIELWGEGSTWFDFRRWDILSDRNKVTILPDGTKQETNHPYVVDPYSLNDLKYIHLLPQREVNNNKELKQDPR